MRVAGIALLAGGERVCPGDVALVKARRPERGDVEFRPLPTEQIGDDLPDDDAPGESSAGEPGGDRQPGSWLAAADQRQPIGGEPHDAESVSHHARLAAQDRKEIGQATSDPG
jgi:hypothetical protein